MFVTLILSALLCSIYASDSAPVIRTEQGETAGFIYESDKITADVYLSIPFAQPPIGELRFKKPQPPLLYAAVRPGTAYTYNCVQDVKNSLVEESEDCLYLNIMRPHGTTETSNLPVLVWIHGGGYSMGSASDYAYPALCDIYLPSDIIVVTIQYRVGVLGFFSTGDAASPGNLGLWDQTAALQWIKSNIDRFGGEPTQVTAWGESAGASSVSLLSLSPHSRDLFARSITQSGSAWNVWSLHKDLQHHSQELAIALGCDQKDTTRRMQCMRAVSTEDIQKALQIIGPSSRLVYSLKFVPTYDGDFLPAPIEQLIEGAPAKPFLIGLKRQEGLFFTTMSVFSRFTQTGVAPHEWDKFDEERLERFIRDSVAPVSVYGKEVNDAQELIIDYYIRRDRPATADYKHWLKRYEELVTSLMFTWGVVHEARTRASLGLPVHMYVSDYYNHATFHPDAPIKGSYHTVAYPFNFRLFLLGEFSFDEGEKRIDQFFRDTFTSFVKTGIPTTSVVDWPRFTTDDPVAVVVNREFSHETEPFHNTYNFWHRTMAKFGFDTPTWNKKDKIRMKTEL